MKDKIIKWGSHFIVLLAILSLSGFSRLQKSPESIPPNVILILMDDMGYGDLECYGGFPYHTPHINELADQGMRFTNFYVAQATCTASRSAILTGCYPNRIGISGAFSPKSGIALNPQEETIAKILKDKGYKTGMVGKWHLGQKPPFLPLHYGFDEFTGLPYSHDYWPVNFDGSPSTDMAGRGQWPTLTLLEGDHPVKEIKNLEDASTLTSLYTAKAVDFIKRNKKRPFFLYFAHSLPHVPLAVSAKFKGKSNAGMFGDVMEEIDWSVGQIMKTLEENGLSKNTVVILISDNGPWLTYGNHAGSSGGLREGKGTAWDGGVKVPAIIRWPEMIVPGTICNKMVASMDLLPTIGLICNAKQPIKKIDGVNILPLLMQQKDANPRDEFVYYYDRCSLKGIRKGDWKLVFPNISQTYKKPGAIADDGFPGRYSTDSVKLALYNLRTDPGETLDLKEKHSELVQQMTAIADRYRKTIGDDLTNQKGTEIRPAARVNPK